MVSGTLVIQNQVIVKISFRDACTFVHDWTPTHWTYSMGQAKIDASTGELADLHVLFFVARLYFCLIDRLPL
jgi:hypothetical protein